MQTKQYKEDQKELVLPDINPMSTNYNQRFGLAKDSPLGGGIIGGGGPISGTNKMSLTSTGGAGFSSNANYGPMPRTMRTINNDVPSGNPGIG